MELKEASVLLVEDEPVLSELMGAWIGRAVGKLLRASNGVEAMEALATHRIDLIISDVRMPVMDGIGLIKKLNETRGPRPQVIFITGFSDLSLREAHDLGAEAVLEKPVTREDLLHEARRSLTEPEELWRKPPAGAAHMKLKSDFESLAAALEEKRIAFGRRGFCIQAANVLHTGPVDFVLGFKADQHIISGQGTVRWTSPQDKQAGVEITHLDDAGRAWMVRLVEQDQPRPYIPGSTGSVEPSKIKSA
ncbi:MAG TPA: response regulator [Candidatus Angelobacter sp.]|jgi:CheY-like chemotaxis protein